MLQSYRLGRYRKEQMNFLGIKIYIVSKISELKGIDSSLDNKKNLGSLKSIARFPKDSYMNNNNNKDIIYQK